jgi:hypothetical protein
MAECHAWTKAWINYFKLSSTIMKSRSLLEYLLILSAALVVLIYFLYPGPSFPFGLEAIECLLSFIVLIATIFLIVRFRSKFSLESDREDIAWGLGIGLLWTMEIGFNNIIQPGIPLRDIVDDSFWGLVAILIFYLAARSSTRSGKMLPGMRTGFLTGLSSGAVACFTALMLICFGMPLITSDPLNVNEWNDVKNAVHYSGMNTYFAYQTLAGAMLHLTVLGMMMGMLLGIIGGLSGKWIFFFRKRKPGISE